MVLVFIFNRTDANLSNGFPSAEYLSDATGFSLRHVRKQIAWLTDNGYLVKTRRGRSGRATVYRLTLPNVKTPTQSHPESVEPTPALPNDPTNPYACRCQGCGNEIDRTRTREYHYRTDAIWHNRCWLANQGLPEFGDYRDQIEDEDGNPICPACAESITKSHLYAHDGWAYHDDPRCMPARPQRTIDDDPWALVGSAN